MPQQRRPHCVCLAEIRVDPPLCSVPGECHNSLLPTILAFSSERSLPCIAIRLLVPRYDRRSWTRCSLPPRWCVAPKRRKSCGATPTRPCVATNLLKASFVLLGPSTLECLDQVNAPKANTHTRDRVSLLTWRCMSMGTTENSMTYSEALRRLLMDHIVPYADASDGRNEFREMFLYTDEV